VEKYGRARQTTQDNIIRRVRSACWITKATTDAQNNYYSLLFRGRSDFSTATQCYVYTHIACLIYILYAQAACYEDILVSYVNLVSIFLPDDDPCKAEACMTP